MDDLELKYFAYSTGSLSKKPPVTIFEQNIQPLGHCRVTSLHIILHDSKALVLLKSVVKDVPLALCLYTRTLKRT